MIGVFYVTAWSIIDSGRGGGSRRKGGRGKGGGGELTERGVEGWRGSRWWSDRRRMERWRDRQSGRRE